MVVYPQTLDYSIIIHQLTHCSESETFWLLNLPLKLFLLN